MTAYDDYYDDLDNDWRYEPDHHWFAEVCPNCHRTATLACDVGECTDTEDD